MNKKVELTIDHIKRKANKIKNFSALNEAIWNAIDADANNIHISTKIEISGTNQKEITEIIISDDGHGIKKAELEDSLFRYGKTKKTVLGRSPSGRAYHGKAGEGRYTYYSLGSAIIWESKYQSGSKTFTYNVIFDSNKTTLNISDDIECKNPKDTPGLIVTITNITELTKSDFLNTDAIKDSIIKEFSTYLFAYPNIKIYLNDEIIDFSSAIKLRKDFSFNIDKLKFDITFIIWNKIKSNELYYCGEGGTVYMVSTFKNLTDNTTAYLKSKYFDELKINGQIDAFDLQQDSALIQDKVEELFLQLIKKTEYEINNELINDLRADEVYPFKSKPQSESEKHEKIVFDMVTSQIRRIEPKIKSANKETRKLAYNLIKEALNTNPNSLTKILKEVFNLSAEEQNRFAKLLDDISLPSIISTMEEVNNRLYFLDELLKIVYDKEGKYIKERTQFQKILVDQIWVFGDHYVYGVDDISLRSVLKEHCKDLGLNDINLTKEDYENKDLNKIPDIILWRKNVYGEEIENLVIEIKRPSKILDIDNVNQIKQYSLNITSDPRFTANKTKWRFILIGNDFDKLVSAEAKKLKNDNSYGDAKLEIIKWGDLIQENKLKYEFFKNASNLKLTDKKVKESINKRWETIFGKESKSPFSDNDK